MVTAGGPLTVRLALVALPRTGKLRLRVSQARAEVRMDGRVIGVAPLEVELDAGGHSLEVSARGFALHRSEVLITAGQQRLVDVVLEKEQGPMRKERIYEKWWFWTAIGVVAAGGAAVAIAVPLSGQTEPPLVGTLSPGAGKVN
jgi:hypothetical protein